ncbi:hypothetical protein [Streptomyces sp. NPDC047525]|uniref:hypothetical protein n=1 Tax=Streptomyces sp. NPDC047525 TaxID=3155264 RepID=UPI0033D477AA
MVISLSLAGVMALIVIVLVRTGSQRIWPGIACALFGFALASTGLAPGITRAIQTIAGRAQSL